LARQIQTEANDALMVLICGVCRFKQKPETAPEHQPMQLSHSRLWLWLWAIIIVISQTVETKRENRLLISGP